MGIFYFFDVPVYRISEEDYYEEMKEYKEKWFSRGGKNEFYEKNPEQKISASNFLTGAFGGIWRYNEIVGYIRLHIVGTQIRGEYYPAYKKRCVKTRKKRFNYMVTHKLAPEMNLPLKGNSASIYQTVLAYLESCKKELSRKMVIDASLFEVIGAYVDWKRMVEEVL